MAIRAIIRVSTVKQDEGPGAQLHAIKGWMQMAGMPASDLVVYEEKISGAVPLAERPAGKLLLEALQPGDTVVASKLDRIGRSAVDLLNVVERWNAMGVRLVVLNMGGTVLDSSSAMSRFFLTILAGVAELERNMIRERTIEGFENMKRENKWTRKDRPFGYELDSDRKMLPHPIEFPILRKICGMTIREAASYLNERGVTTPAGGKWSPGQIQRVTAREQERRNMAETAIS